MLHLGLYKSLGFSWATAKLWVNRWNNLVFPNLKRFFWKCSCLSLVEEEMLDRENEVKEY
jgi:hypothetical protein